MDDTLSRKNLPLIFQLSANAKAYYKDVEILSSTTRLDLTKPIDVVIKAADGTTSNWTIAVESNYDQIGLGKVEYSKSVKSLYNWYIDQGSSGSTKLSDGGTACILMARLWQTASSSTDFASVRAKIDELRALNTPSGQPVPYLNGNPINTTDVINYIKTESSSLKVIQLTEQTTELRECIDNGYIAILCLDMNRIRYNPRSYERVEKFYSTSNTYGHFVVVKGYKYLPGGTYYFEVYDPLSLGARYRDNNELKGKDRFYHSSFIYEAARTYWPYAIVIGPPSISMDKLPGEVAGKGLIDGSGY